MANWRGLLLAVVCFCSLLQVVLSQGAMCIDIENCMEQFTSAVREFRHVRESFCIESDKQVRCMSGAIQGCSSSQRPYAQNRLQAAKTEYEQQCDACLAVASFWLVSLGAILSTLYNRWLWDRYICSTVSQHYNGRLYLDLFKNVPQVLCCVCCLNEIFCFLLQENLINSTSLIFGSEVIVFCVFFLP